MRNSDVDDDDDDSGGDASDNCVFSRICLNKKYVSSESRLSFVELG